MAFRLSKGTQNLGRGIQFRACGVRHQHVLPNQVISC